MNWPQPVYIATQQAFLRTDQANYSILGPAPSLCHLGVSLSRRAVGRQGTSGAVPWEP